MPMSSAMTATSLILGNVRVVKHLWASQEELQCGGKFSKAENNGILFLLIFSLERFVSSHKVLRWLKKPLAYGSVESQKVDASLMAAECLHFQSLLFEPVLK